MENSGENSVVTSKSKRKIKQYEIIEVIGQGGMGKVYKALDTNMQRIVALKVMLEKKTEVSLQRFKREALTMAKLNHPNILEIYESGNDGDIAFISMPFIEGESLKALMKKEKLPLRQIVRMIAKIAEAVDHAHKNGVIHRDLKPDNILLDDGEPKVMDFGLAKLSKSSQKLSKTEQFIGTLHYMSPEQVSGERLNNQSDIYSLGVILYELLTGAVPIRGKNFANLMVEMMRKEIVPPSQLNKRVSKDLENVCLKALEKKPQDRYGNARAFSRDLKRSLIGKSSVAMSPKNALFRRSKRILSQHKHLIIAASILLLSWATKNIMSETVDRYQVLIDDSEFIEDREQVSDPIKQKKKEREEQKALEQKALEQKALEQKALEQKALEQKALEQKERILKEKKQEDQRKKEQVLREKNNQKKLTQKQEALKKKQEALKKKQEALQEEQRQKKYKFKKIKARKRNKKKYKKSDIYKILKKRNIEYEKIRVFSKHEYLVMNTRQSYLAAKELCAAIGGYPLTVTTTKESDFITSLLQNKKAYWLALERNKKNDFEWITGESISNTNWNFIHNPFGKGEDKSTAVVTAKIDDQKTMWSKRQNKDKYFVICEWGSRRRPELPSQNRTVLASMYIQKSLVNSYNSATSYNFFNQRYQSLMLNNPIEPMVLDINIKEPVTKKVFLALQHFAGSSEGKSNTRINVQLNNKLVTQNFQILNLGPVVHFFDISQYVKQGANKLTIGLSRTSNTLCFFNGFYIYNLR
ncbi:protein kinase [Candidatus Uabimicrobium sp. HlEnr_7]|uniref:protein kinase domain-containing protein n=1 Tax=Candidatus Uabimicrobium helgolandensis TaxID=3095367 RepID=UPI00355696C6